MTDGLSLEDVYGATLGRIKAQGSQKCRLAMTALMWVCYSERHLGAEELCHALAVEIGATNCNIDNVSSIQTVLSCCQGLIMVDKEGSTVRLIHHTLQEYLESHRNPFPSPHSTIAETCLTYLNSQHVIALSRSHVEKALHPPFLEYSSLYWGVHMKKEHSHSVEALALRLLSSCKGHVSIKLLLDHLIPHYYSATFNEDSCSFTGLHWASTFGLIEVVRTLIMMDGLDINGVCKITGTTPILWAAMRGHEAVVKLLLGRKDINPDRPDYYLGGRTPLSWAAGNGHEAVVKLLLGCEDVNPNKSDNCAFTPIFFAAENGHEEVAKLLLGRKDVNLDNQASGGYTPIVIAARNGHEAVVKLLLGCEDVNPNKPESWGKTPISLAAENGHEAVVKLLLRRDDVSPSRPDTRGRTPISLAAENRHWAVVKLLREREGVNPDRLDL